MSPRSTQKRPKASRKKTVPKNVLVTGASMPIGERLVRFLLEDSRIGHVVAVSRDDPKTLPIGPDDRLDVYQVDLSSSRRLHDLMFGPVREVGVDVVVHTAMYQSAYAEGSRVHRFNVEGVRSIIEFSERHPTIKRLVIRSSADVYQVQRDLPNLIAEDHPLNMAGHAPQWVRDRVEADVSACTRMGMSRADICVIRMAEVLAPGTGSQLFDYLQSPFCLRPAGYDPMINVLTIDDAATALQRALHSDSLGAFNVPGADTLPLSECIRKWGRVAIPVPGWLMNPVYRARRRLTGLDFRYGMNRRRFHYSGVLDGERARSVLGFVPSHAIRWPVE
jgi:UDP-glucose 4-epimerase